MLSRDKKIQLSPYNKIGDVMSFYESDWFLWEFIDYVWFYWSRKHERVLHLLKSDNGWSIYLSKNLVLNSLNGFWNFRGMVSVSLYWSPINIIQLREITLNWKIVLDVDLYWKGCKLIREEWLRDELYLLFTYYLWMSEITITRADYTVDCIKKNFRKANSLACRKSWLIRENGELSYMTFWRKSHDTARFLRYYDKKMEIESRWTSHLYPEYSLLPNVMRYELQVNSKGFDKFEKEITIDELYSFITLQKEISSRKRKHYTKDKDRSLENVALDAIKKLIQKKEYDSLERIKMLLLGKEYLDFTNSKCSID